HTSALNHKQLTLLSTYGELKRQHAQVRFELMKAEGRLAAYKARGPLMDKVTISESAVKAILESDPVVQGHRKTLIQVEEALERFFNAGAPKTDSTVISLKSRREALEKQIAARQTEQRPKVLEHRKLKAKDE